MEKIIEIVSAHRAAHGLDINSLGFCDLVRQHIESRGPKSLLADSARLLESGRYPTGESLTHENGFKKISIYKDSITGFQIRVHLWPKGVEDASIHNHRWNFFSYVLSGEIVASNFTIASSASEKAVQLLRLSNADDSLVKQTRVVDKVQYWENNRTTIGAGGMHYVHDSLMHRVTSPSGAVTLMLTGIPTKDHSEVIRLKTGGKVRERMSVAECVGAMLGEC
jgi:hypothetical protein